MAGYERLPGSGLRLFVAATLGLGLALSLLACGSSSNTHPGQAHQAEQRPNHGHGAAAGRRPAKPAPASQAQAPEHRHIQARASVCPPFKHSLDGVYHPYRLRVRDSCRHISGTVDDVRDEEDGDIHIIVRLDPRYRGMLVQGNYAAQGGDLVVEFMPRDYGHLPRPAVGDRLSLIGAYVLDTDHGWAELHPVFSAQINGGPVHRSGPQFGGSPFFANAANAVATCRTNTGKRCRGYNGEIAPPPDDEGASGGGGHGGGNGGGSSGSSGGGCTPGYSPCIAPGPDVDCQGQGGDGPRYVAGPVKVTGSDPYDLDGDGNGIGCQ